MLAPSDGGPRGRADEELGGTADAVAEGAMAMVRIGWLAGRF
jgi:hypothetical protein